jgi:membrane protein DedA with SNARE-associated domain
MYSAAIDAGVGLIAQYGLFALLVAFALEGALVGKVIPTRGLFVAAIIALGTDTVGMASVVLVAVVGATLGQLTLFVLIRRTELTLDVLPGAADPGFEGRFDGWFERWGVSAIALSNALPIARGSLTVPAAMTGTDPLRFSASSIAGTSVYATGLVGVAAVIDVLVTIV